MYIYKDLMYLILITHFIVYTLISEFTSHFNLLHVKNTFLCKYLYIDNTYGRKTVLRHWQKKYVNKINLPKQKKYIYTQSYSYAHVYITEHFLCN